jgi:hypothetical protein
LRLSRRRLRMAVAVDVADAVVAPVVAAASKARR